MRSILVPEWLGMNFKIITILVLIINIVCGQEVETTYGTIKGKTTNNHDGTPLYVFLGIPYAIPPVAELRFKDPEPLTEPYPNKLITATEPTKCVQYSSSIKKVIGQENCLHLNIYTTTLDRRANHDVIFYIHGGAFIIGSGHTQTPEHLFVYNKNIVFVSINYRLGPFGFLSTDDHVVPGNMGLKDQVVALKWVKSNIERFGGNPGNIVLAGTSSGASCVHLHYLSPLSRDLFAKGISIGGGALSPTLKTKNIKEGLEHLVKLFPDCLNDETLKIVSCLSEISKDEIIQQLLVPNKPIEDTILYYFRPVVEKGGAKPFLEEHPFHLFRKGMVNDAPWLLSTTTSEGLIPAGSFVYNSQQMTNLDQNWNSIAPFILNFKDLAEGKDMPMISDLVRKHYLGDKRISLETREAIIKLFGDRLHSISMENSLRLHAAASKTNTYMYMFDYKGTQSLAKLTFRTDEYLGVCHSDDLIYILKMKYFNLQEEDKAIQQILIQIWSSFIKDGTPDTGTGVSWPAVSRKVTYVGNIDYVLIDKKPKLMSKPGFSDRVFWDSLPLDELHLSGVLYVPKYIQDLQKPSKLVALLKRLKYTTLLWMKALPKKRKQSSAVKGV